MSSALLDVTALRARFSALDRPLAFFDAPSGTQVPDEVVDAITRYLREANANVSPGGEYETARRTNELIEEAHTVAARFLGCAPGETTFGANMTTLNFALSRAATRDLRPGDEIVVTALDHDGNVAPWLELARDRELVVKFAGIDDDCHVDVADIERQLTERTRIVAFPLASNMLGTIADTPAIAALAHEAGALAWGDAVHYAAHVPIDVAALGLDVLLCSSYKFYGPHLGLAYVKEDVAEGWRPYKARPAPDAPPGRRFETGTQPHELLAGFIAAVEYIESVGWEAIHQHERELGERFLASLPEHCRLYGPNRMDKRVSTFSFTVDGVAPAEVAAALGRWEIAVGHGDFYAVEIARRLGLPDGVVRAGLVHYNTDEEVDRLLGGLARLA